MGVQEIKRAFAGALGQSASVTGARLYYQRPGDTQTLEFDCRKSNGNSLTWTYDAGSGDPVEGAKAAAEALIASGELDG